MLYLIHFDRPFHHANHYLGFVDGGGPELTKRIATHRAGAGSRLLRAVVAAGIGFRVVRTFAGGRADERRLKKEKKTRGWCPVCNARPWTAPHLKEAKSAPAVIAAGVEVPL